MSPNPWAESPAPILEMRRLRAEGQELCGPWHPPAFSPAWRGEPLPLWSLFQHMHCGQVGVQHIYLPRYV